MPIRESSNQIDKIQDRGVPNAVYEGTLTQTAQLSSLSTGYQCILTQDLSFLNLGFQVPEVSAVYQFATGLGGGSYGVNHYKLPFVIWNTNGTIEESATLNVYYTYLAQPYPTGPAIGSPILQIKYYNRTSSSAGQIFFYKIRSSDAANSDSAYRRTQ